MTQKERNEHDYAQYHLNKSKGLCPTCYGKRKAAKGKVLCKICATKCRLYTAKKTKENPELMRGRVKTSIRKVRHEVMKAYGGKCACCGESYDPFLCIDHIGGGGNKHRRDNKLISGFQTYYWLRRHNFPEGFRVLCWNCNAARAYFGKECDPKHKNHSI